MFKHINKFTKKRKGWEVEAVQYLQGTGALTLEVPTKMSIRATEHDDFKGLLKWFSVALANLTDHHLWTGSESNDLLDALAARFPVHSIAFRHDASDITGIKLVGVKKLSNGMEIPLQTPMVDLTDLGEYDIIDALMDAARAMHGEAKLMLMGKVHNPQTSILDEDQQPEEITVGADLPAGAVPADEAAAMFIRAHASPIPVDVATTTLEDGSRVVAAASTPRRARRVRDRS